MFQLKVSGAERTNGRVSSAVTPPQSYSPMIYDPNSGVATRISILCRTGIFRPIRIATPGSFARGNMLPDATSGYQQDVREGLPEWHITRSLHQSSGAHINFQH